MKLVLLAYKSINGVIRGEIAIACSSGCCLTREGFPTPECAAHLSIILIKLWSKVSHGNSILIGENQRKKKEKIESDPSLT
jgi:hypothetical protein